jgi:hypothetical protein
VLDGRFRPGQVQEPRRRSEGAGVASKDLQAGLRQEIGCVGRGLDAVALGQPETEIKAIYGSGQGTYDGFAKMFRSTRFLETVAEFSREHYRWPSSFTLKMETCGHPGTDYDDEARVVTMCYETSFDFAELYRAYIEPPPVAAAVPLAAKRRRSR